MFLANLLSGPALRAWPEVRTRLAYPCGDQLVARAGCHTSAGRFMRTLSEAPRYCRFAGRYRDGRARHSRFRGAEADGLQGFLFARDGRRTPGDIDTDEDRAHADDLDRSQRFVEEQPREHRGGDRGGK